MTITRKDEPGRIILSVAGWIDSQTVAELESAFNELPQVQELVYDFSSLEYISSAGIRNVVAAYRRQMENGGTFEVKDAGPEVMEVFKLTGIDKRIPVTEKQA